MSEKIKTAVVGVGYLGRFHAQKYHALPDSELVAVVDASENAARAVGEELGVAWTTDLDSVLPQVDAVSVAVTTSAHFNVAMKCLEAGKHILIEKPITPTLEEAEKLVAFAEEKGVLMQVGFLERFNPAFLTCRDKIVKPQFIETIRIASFLERGADVDVILDLMSHDLDLVLDLVDSPVKELHGVGKSLMTENTDLANVRIIFEDGCVANMTVSRISSKVERKLRVFQHDSYFSMDFAEPYARMYWVERQEQGPPSFSGEKHDLKKGDSLMLEIENFLGAISGKNPPAVSGRDGLRSMRVAGMIMEDIEKNRLP